MITNDNFTIPSKVFDWTKWWYELSSIERQNWYRYWRLERIEYLRQEKRDRKFKDYLFEKYYLKEKLSQ